MPSKVVLLAAVLLVFPACLSAQQLAERLDAPSATGTPRSTEANEIHASGTRSIQADDRYDARPLWEAIFGDEYRDIWTMNVELPVLDMSRTAGGLTVTGSAGGLQSTLLFLDGQDGREFILRTIEKDAGGALPEGARRTIIEDIAQDQVSSLNPFAALAVPVLAEAAGVLYTDPALVIVPDDDRLGSHREQFAGKPALLERKVDEDVSDLSRFGYPEEVVDYDDMLDRIEADPRARVDQQAFVRARLFDMWIGDRDRHDGQYFWAISEGGSRIVPLPIDRDFAFARFDGFFNRIGRFTGKTDLRKLTYFGPEIDNLRGLNYQGAKLDIRFTSELERSDWINAARDLQDRLTDDVIERAVASWPQPVRERIGTELSQSLRSRRSTLVEAAEAYYVMLTQKVDVVATDRPDRVRVMRSLDFTDVTIETEGAGEWYRRRFLADETDQIRVFGLDDADTFVVEGHSSDPKILLIGGRGHDDVQSAGGSRDVLYFDTEDDVPGRAARFRTTDDDLDYIPHRYELDRLSPHVSFEYDSDEGIYLGGGAKMIRYGFQKKPYAARHALAANYAPYSRGFNIHYDGHVVNALGPWDGRWEADVLDEEEFDDFYGIGNETSGSEDVRDRYQAQFRWVRVYPAFTRTIGEEATLGFGPYFEYADIEPPGGFTEDQPTPGFTREHMTDQYFAGIRSRFELDRRDTTFLPRSGLHALAEAGVHAGVRHAEERFARLAGEISYFITPPLPGRVTLALRGGGATNIGDYTFYQANSIGGRSNVRGFAKTRFSGHSSAYANAEIRVKLTDLNIYLTRGELGVTGFYDVGRVWAEGESSSIWHRGYGGGLWYTPFNRFIVNAYAAYSDEGRRTRISFGMFF